MTPRVLVLGGTGFVGTALCERLQRAGVRVTVPTRRRLAAQHLLPMPGVLPVEADVHEAAALARRV